MSALLLIVAFILSCLNTFALVVFFAAASVISSKIHILEKSMSRLSEDVGKVENLVGSLREEIASLRDTSTGALSQAEQDALADRLEALIGSDGESTASADIS